MLLTLTSKFLQQIARFQLSRGVTDTALLLPDAEADSRLRLRTAKNELSVAAFVVDTGK